jgi:hypothetical protein
MVEKSSFHQLEMMEQHFGGENLSKPNAFFRRGKSGQWREYFSAELYRKYCSENGPTLLRIGCGL